jgi:hypothetical protein
LARPQVAVPEGPSLALVSLGLTALLAAGLSHWPVEKAAEPRDGLLGSPGSDRFWLTTGAGQATTAASSRTAEELNG